MDVLSAHGDAQCIGIQLCAVAVGAVVVGEELLVIFVLPCTGLCAVFDHFQNALVHQGLGLTARAEVTGDGHLLGGAVQESIPRLFRVVAEGSIERYAVFSDGLTDEGAVPAVVGEGFEAVDGNGAFGEGQGFIGDDFIGIHGAENAETRTGGAGSEGIVEGKHSRFQLAEGDSVLGAGVVGGEFGFHGLAFSGYGHHNHGSVGFSQGAFHGVGEAAAEIGLHDQAVDNQFHGVAEVLVQLNILGEIVQDAVDAGADIAVLSGIGEDFLLTTLFSADNGGENHESFALGERHDFINDDIHGGLTDFPAAHGAMGHAQSGIQKAEVVIDFGDGAHGGSGVFGCGFLVDGNGGGQTLNGVHVGLIHLTDEHPGIGGQGFHESSVTFGVDGIEGEGGFPGSGQPGDDDQLISGDIHVDVFQVVHACSADGDVFWHTDYLMGVVFFFGLQPGCMG